MPATSALLVIDVQQGLCQGEYAAHDVPGLIARLNGLSARARAAGAPVFFIQHEAPSGLLQHDSPGWALAEGLTVAEGDLRVRKTTPDSFMHTGLEAHLHQRGIARVVICGLQTEFCVDTTTRRAMAQGAWAAEIQARAVGSCGAWQGAREAHGWPLQRARNAARRRKSLRPFGLGRIGGPFVVATLARTCRASGALRLDYSPNPSQRGPGFLPPTLLGFPFTLVADGHSTMDSAELSAPQIIAHHNRLLPQISSFGPRTRCVRAEELRFD